MRIMKTRLQQSDSFQTFNLIIHSPSSSFGNYIKSLSTCYISLFNLFFLHMNLFVKDSILFEAEVGAMKTLDQKTRKKFIIVVISCNLPSWNNHLFFQFQVPPRILSNKGKQSLIPSAPEIRIEPCNEWANPKI